MPNEPDATKRQCTLLLFVATSSEEEALENSAKARGIPFEKTRDPELNNSAGENTIGWEISVTKQSSPFALLARVTAS